MYGKLSVYIPLFATIDSYSDRCDLIESIALTLIDSYFLIADDLNNSNQIHLIGLRISQVKII